MTSIVITTDHLKQFDIFLAVQTAGVVALFWAKGRRDFNRLRIGGIVTTSCRRWETFFTAVRESASVATSLRRLAGAIPARMGSWLTGVARRQPVMVRKALFSGHPASLCGYSTRQ